MSKARICTWSIALGLTALVVWSISLAWISESFAYESDILDKPVWTFVAMQVAAGAVYLVTLFALRHRPSTRGLLMVIIAVGLLMRVTQIAAVPVLEDDYYRYLWDGAMTAQGHNPYAYSSEQIQQSDHDIPVDLINLAEASGSVVERINHPWLRTIYPPTAQAAFVLAYWIKPFDIVGLRLVWLGLDLIILGMFLRLLRGRSTLCFSIAIYWLNPMAIKEVFNAGHMELVLVIGLVAALLAMYRGMHKTGALLLGLAVGAKLWPVFWLPLFLRYGRKSWQHGACMLTAFIVPVVAMAIPIILGRLDAGSGFTAYAQRWQMNDSIYLIIHELAQFLSFEHAHLMARMTIGVVLLGVMAFSLRRFKPNFEGLISSVMMFTAALFLLSPTQFPWYYLWVLPVLTLRPIWSLLALTMTLPLYYLRFPLDAMGYAVWFDYGVIWIEFIPIWLLLAWELWRANRHGFPPSSQETPPCTAANA